MIYSLVCFAVIALCASARDLNEYSFADYMREFNKRYSASEIAEREALFNARVAQVLAHNANPSPSYTLGINHMSDWTDAEQSGLLGYHKGIGHLNRAQLAKGATNKEARKSTAFPSHVDWREKGIITPVKNQGHCGSCWTFSAAETIESHWAIHTGSLQELSQQQIASCTDNPKHCGGTGGCSGGTAQVAFDGVVKAGGIATEWSYPYRSWFGTDFECAFNASDMDIAAKVSARKDIATNEYDDLMEAISQVGPVAISVDASTWHQYEGGVYNGCDMDKPDINHAVQLVGYGTDSKHGDYWLVRNSWGTGWGEDGYIRVARNTKKCGIDTTPQDGSGCDGGPDSVEVCGMCGILYDNTYPIVDWK